MNSDYKLLILYHSGAGSTKTLAEIYYGKLKSYPVDISPINLEYDYESLKRYDFLIFAFPTYHCEPSTSMIEFIKGMPTFEADKKAFLFTTCGLYSGNALRIFAKECSSKNILICGYSEYRAPASDGVLLLPSIPLMFNYEKNISNKIRRDINRINETIEKDIDKIKIPSFKLYSILNYPNKVLGKAHKHNIKLLKEYCVNCNKCVDECIRHCWNNDKDYPKYNIANCEYCFRCIHHCPKEAIVLSNKTRKKPKLHEKYYADLKEKVEKEFKLSKV